jgi:2-polyprenyl-3-methyl-5-hydroxy-6-metoxy-1,4-benzoquinol methylase
MNITCPCCRASAFKVPLDTDGGPYMACTACGTSYQQSVLEKTDNVQDKFEEEQDRFYGDDSVMLAPGFETLQDGATRRRLQVIRRFMQSGRLFEVGPGNGKTLMLMKQNGFEVDAVEHAEVLANAVAKSTDAKVYHGDFNALELTQQYDAYMSFHVIEHVPDFIAHLAKAAEITKTGGFAFIATPNIGSLEHRVARGLAPNYSTAHLQLFSRKGMEAAFAQTGWKLVDVKTPEYPISWLRVVTAFMRNAKGKGKAVARGGYASAASPKMIRALKIYAILSWPLRKVQEALGLGEELFIVAQKR